MCLSLHRELKEKIQPEILELIKQQRLNRLVEGTCFRKLNCRRRQGIVLGATPPLAGVNSGLAHGESQGHGCWFKVGHIALYSDQEEQSGEVLTAHAYPGRTNIQKYQETHGTEEPSWALSLLVVVQ